MRTLTFKRVVGAGAMGTVYFAELRAPGGFSRSCAVKVMKSKGASNQSFMARMRDEARLLGMLQLESVMGVSELVTVNGQDAVVMEYVEGADLHDLIKQGRVPPRALAELGAELAGTLFRTHTARHPQTGAALCVIHRDVKPANVMLTARGGVRLLDFGVARAAFDSRESHTQGLVLGTLNYFAPEILAGNDPTPAVDIYGLALALWECAAGKSWGSPKVQKARFDSRVARRLKELPPEYALIVEALRPVLSWDPLDRPDGGMLEEALVEIAERCSGPSLRAWARNAVPVVRELKKTTKVPPDDPLLGQTFTIGSIAVLGDERADAPPVSPPVKKSKRGYDDLGPIAAVATKAAVVPVKPAPSKRRAWPLWAMALLGIFLGLLFGGCVVLVGLVLLVAVFV